MISGAMLELEGLGDKNFPTQHYVMSPGPRHFVPLWVVNREIKDIIISQ